MQIEVLHRVDDQDFTAIRELIGQLSSSGGSLTRVALEDVATSEASTLFVARDGLRIVGTLTLVMFPIPTGRRAWIEDVVVDESARGQGVGTALTRRAIERAREAGARTVDLTSRPSRGAANAMYSRLGFRQRTTNVYRFDIS